MIECSIITSFKAIQQEASLINSHSQIIAVTKNQPVYYIEALLKEGHRTFAENRIQEAKTKWLPLKGLYHDIELHMIGHLQTNKIKEAVKVFDIIETIDSLKIAKLLMKEMQVQNKFLKCYIQINTGKEPQKSGIMPDTASDFINICKYKLNLPIEGLMCIPPLNNDPAPHFALLQNIAKEHNIEILSMGMSDSYKIALKFGASHIRIGSAIFGSRP
ncbi:MAG: YggS family pyridoxal phosphate-dependent enzyme [Rickettsiales endosymbiont of Dermacentor nuttalli]